MRKVGKSTERGLDRVVSEGGITAVGTAMTLQVGRRLFTAAEYHRMAEAGILNEDDRLELIEGEVVRMSPIGRRHAACVDRLNDAFSRRYPLWQPWVRHGSPQKV